MMPSFTGNSHKTPRSQDSYPDNAPPSQKRRIEEEESPTEGTRIASLSEGWSQLPLELLSQIFSVLPLADLCCVARVCKAWNSITSPCITNALESDTNVPSLQLPPSSFSPHHHVIDLTEDEDSLLSVFLSEETPINISDEEVAQFQWESENSRLQQEMLQAQIVLQPQYAMPQGYRTFPSQPPMPQSYSPLQMQGISQGYTTPPSYPLTPQSYSPLQMQGIPQSQATLQPQRRRGKNNTVVQAQQRMPSSQTALQTQGVPQSQATLQPQRRRGKNNTLVQAQQRMPSSQTALQTQGIPQSQATLQPQQRRGKNNTLVQAQQRMPSSQTALQTQGIAQSQATLQPQQRRDKNNTLVQAQQRMPSSQTALQTQGIAQSSRTLPSQYATSDPRSAHLFLLSSQIKDLCSIIDKSGFIQEWKDGKYLPKISETELLLNFLFSVHGIIKTFNESDVDILMKKIWGMQIICIVNDIYGGKCIIKNKPVAGLFPNLLSIHDLIFRIKQPVEVNGVQLPALTLATPDQEALLNALDNSIATVLRQGSGTDL